jgi:nicotinamide-nucleotide amidase
MRAMFVAEVAPEVRAAATGGLIRSRTVQTIGLPESELGARIRDLMRRGANPEVGTTAELSVIGVRINATARDGAACDALLNAAEREVRVRLGDAVFGVDGDTLASVVGRQLVAAGRTLSVAESCTGGLLGALLTDVPGSSAYFRGGLISYADAVKRDALGVPQELLSRHGAVSAPVAAAMAEGAAQRFQTDYALAITGVAGPAGGSEAKPVGLVFVALSTPTETRAQELRLGADAPREAIRVRSARAALNLLRLACGRGGAPRAV